MVILNKLTKDYLYNRSIADDEDDNEKVFK